MGRGRPSCLATGAALLCGAACLPSDDRPPPGNVTFTVSPSPAVRDGITTDDGWALSFSRLMLGIGRVGLSDTCTEYTHPWYDRLLDVTNGSGQKLALFYGLGRCDIRFRIQPPSFDGLLGTGVGPTLTRRTPFPCGSKAAPSGTA
jgi:hypothetical protein